MYIMGTEKALPKGQKHLTPCKIKARVGRPVNIKGSEDFSDRRKAYEFIGEKIMTAIGKLKDE